MNVVVTGSGGAASSSAAASGASGASGAGGGPAGLGALLLAAGKKKKKRQSGITAAKKQYTDRRKVKMAEMRSLKSKRIREHTQKTKTMAKAERDKARKAFKEKVNAQYREASKRFPPARGLKDVTTIKLGSVRMAR